MKTILCTVLFAIGLTGVVVAGVSSMDVDSAQIEVSDVASETVTSTPVSGEQCVSESASAELPVSAVTAQSEVAAGDLCTSCFRRTPCPIQCHIQCGGCQ